MMNPGVVTEAEQRFAASGIGSASVSEYGNAAPYFEGGMEPLVAGHATPASGTQKKGEDPAIPSDDAETEAHGEACKAEVGATRLDRRTADEEQGDVDYSKMLADYLDSIASDPVSDHVNTVYGGGALGLSTALDAGHNCPPMNDSTASPVEQCFEENPDAQKQDEHSSLPQEPPVLPPNRSRAPVIQSLVAAEGAALVSGHGSAKSALPPSRPVAPLGSQPVPGGPKRCTRNGCPNPAVESRDWDNEYCSSECVIAHCKDVFKTWVGRRQLVAATKVGH